MLVVKTFLDVTDASVNPDILDETIKLVGFLRLKKFHLEQSLSSCLHFNFLIISLPRYRLSWEALRYILHVLSPKYCLRIFNWVPLSFFIYVHFPIYSLLNTTSHFHIMRIATFNNQDLDWGPHWKQFWQVKFPHQVIIRK